MNKNDEELLDGRISHSLVTINLLFLLYFWVLTVYVDNDTNQFLAISRKSPIVIMYLANLD